MKDRTSTKSLLRTTIATTIALVLALSAIVIVLQRSAHKELPTVLKDRSTQVLSSTNPESVYADDPADSWNQIFRLLFSRTVKVTVADDRSAKSPFTNLDEARGGIRGLRVNREVIDRFELGDRAIDPLYPSFFNNAGVRYVLVEPQFSQLKKALTTAINEKIHGRR